MQIFWENFAENHLDTSQMTETEANVLQLLVTLLVRIHMIFDMLLWQ